MSVELVGFGQASEGAGEVADLPGVDDGDGNCGLVELTDQEGFESAGRFDADELHVVVLELADQAVDAVQVVGDRGAGIGGSDGDVELSFGDIDAGDGAGFHRGSLPCKFELVCGTAHATVRAARREPRAIRLLTV